MKLISPKDLQLSCCLTNKTSLLSPIFVSVIFKNLLFLLLLIKCNIREELALEHVIFKISSNFMHTSVPYTCKKFIFYKIR